VYGTRYGGIASRTEDEQRVLWEGDEAAQGRVDVVLKDWRRLLGELLNDCGRQRKLRHTSYRMRLQSSSAT
jgi:hypothetical protein